MSGPKLKADGDWRESEGGREAVYKTRDESDERCEAVWESG